MIWILWFALFVWLVDSHKRIRRDNKDKEGFYDKINDLSDNKERYQRSIYDRDISSLSQFYENPKMSCPYKYEEAQDVLLTLKEDPKKRYHGFTGSNFKYDDDRHVIWDKLSQPLPIHADFFKS